MYDDFVAQYPGWVIDDIRLEYSVDGEWYTTDVAHSAAYYNGGEHTSTPS
jgi:hypothetical protein